ncbi:MAG: GNAT family N-acetyltransferase [Thermoplasmata archaeon]
MRFLTYDELTPSMEVDRTLIHLASFGGAFARRSIDLWRRRSHMFADYVGVFAVERGRLLGQTLVFRIPYTFPDGTELVSGIAAVGTRPDRGRAGVARAILTEIHRREEEAGVRYSTLWTNRSWGAHGLYEKLGYRDVYSSPWAVRAPALRPGKRAPGVRPAHASDLIDLERLHARRAVGRLGFLRNESGYLDLWRATGDLDPAKELIVSRSGSRITGYAHVDSNPYRTICGELVATSARAWRNLLGEVGRRAKRTPVAFQHTPVTDHPGWFRGIGCTLVNQGWYVFMATQLGRQWSAPSARTRFATTDPRFLCLAGDRF